MEKNERAMPVIGILIIMIAVSLLLVQVNMVEAVEYNGPYEVISVDGGNNIIVSKNGKDTRMMMIGVYCGEYDSPEWNMAKRYTEERLLGEKVKIVYDKDSDKDMFCEKVYIYDENGVMLNGELLSNGIAEYDYVGNNKKFARKLKSLAKKARREKVGIWK